MVNHRDINRSAARRITAVLTLIAAAVPLVCFSAPTVHAQNMMRSPNLNIGPRVPSISTVARSGPNISAIGRTGTITSRLPDAHFSHRSYPSCDYVNRAASGECVDKSTTVDNGGSGAPPKRGQGKSPGRNNPQAAVTLRYVVNEIIAEIDGSQADEMARRHRLTRVESQNFPLVGSTLGLFRITDGRSVETVRAELAADASVRSVQPNFRYFLQDQKPAQVPSEGDPAQYALAKLRLPQAHVLAHGDNITIAVIDSAVDAAHPELAGSITDFFDALGSKEGPHVHGTGIAGAIVAHARLMGGAPSAKILAIRAFGTAQSGAESTSFVIVKSLDYAASHGAQIVNMSFAGPKDPVVERGVAAAATRGMVLVAASGNAGAKSPPLYPAANPNVIAVSAVDASDKLFPASNRGAHIAIAAPGVDIFLPAPDGKYQMTSGTSFSAAYISGVAALILERNPALKPEQLRTILTRTARDLGAPGRDDLFGAGEADAFAAVSAVQTDGVPVATAPPRPEAPAETRKVSADQVVPTTRALASEQPAAPQSASSK
jgi:hypothetical protein